MGFYFSLMLFVLCSLLEHLLDCCQLFKCCKPLHWRHLNVSSIVERCIMYNHPLYCIAIHAVSWWNKCSVLLQNERFFCKIIFINIIENVQLLQALSILSLCSFCCALHFCVKNLYILVEAYIEWTSFEATV